MASAPHPRGVFVSYWVGTSGYNYPEWKGTFYPEKIPSANDAASAIWFAAIEIPSPAP